MAVFVVLGIHLSGLVDALRDRPLGAEYLALPMTFWVVKFYDLGIVAPAALAVGVGLLRRQSWARKPAYGILGGYVLLAWSGRRHRGGACCWRLTPPHQSGWHWP